MVAGRRRNVVASSPAAALFLAVMALPSALVGQPSPNAGLVGREIKALSAEQVEEYLEGQGMGMAMAAELNGYPGPRHVLELAAELELTGEQAAAVEARFDAMHDEAVRLGRAIVELERGVEALFASGEALSGAVEETIRAIGRLSGELRFAHLEAHVATRPLLTAVQLERYARLRGYAESSSERPHQHPAHGRHEGHEGSR
jgi:hypothetical protein